MTDPLLPLLKKALAAREALSVGDHLSAYRLFNGFTEGWPGLVIDLYGRTVVFQDHGRIPLAEAEILLPAQTPAARGSALAGSRSVKNPQWAGGGQARTPAFRHP